MTQVSDKLRKATAAVLELADAPGAEGWADGRPRGMNARGRTALERRFDELNVEALGAQNGIHVLRQYLSALRDKPHGQKSTRRSTRWSGSPTSCTPIWIGSAI